MGDQKAVIPAPPGPEWRLCYCDEPGHSHGQIVHTSILDRAGQQPVPGRLWLGGEEIAICSQDYGAYLDIATDFDTIYVGPQADGRIAYWKGPTSHSVVVLAAGRCPTGDVAAAEGREIPWSSSWAAPLTGQPAACAGRAHVVKICERSRAAGWFYMLASKPNRPIFYVDGTREEAEARLAEGTKP